MIIKIIGAMFVFGLLVSAHELGHFMVAKLTGMRVDEFAIGFGPKVWSKKHGETLYTLREQYLWEALIALLVWIMR